MKNKTQYIADFIMDGNPKRFEKMSEPIECAFKEFNKVNPTINVSAFFFVRMYNALVHTKRFQTKRACRISDLLYGTYFSFKKNGKVFVAGNRSIIPGKTDYAMSLHYFGVTTRGHFHGHLNYPLLVARSKTVYLHDVTNTASTKIPPSKIQQKYEI